MSDFIYPVNNQDEFEYADHTPFGLYFDNTYGQLLYGEQSLSSMVSGYAYFDNKFVVPYSYSVSSNYYAVAQLLSNLTENGWDAAAYQKRTGIWATPSQTSTSQSVVKRFQQVQLSSYYYGDEIAQGSFRMYYLPITTTQPGSLSGLQNQTVLRFMDINHNFNGPSFAITSSTGLATTLSGTTTGMTVEMLLRPFGQPQSGYLFHRWTTDGNNVVDSYSASATGTLAAYPFYSAYPYYGVGARVSNLSPVINSDAVKPYIDFYVYGALTGSRDHYLSLSAGQINENVNTRFFLQKTDIATIFDGSFHSLKFVWSTDPFYSHGRVYLDGKELVDTVNKGTGRTTPLNYGLTSSLSTTPIYFLSKPDNIASLSSQSSSINSTYAEVKQIMMFDKPLTGQYLASTLTGYTDSFNTYLSSSGSLKMWFGFSGSSNAFVAVDRQNSLTGKIVNDVSVTTPEGSISPIYSLIYDRPNYNIASVWDGSASAALQLPVGKLFNSEYGVGSTAYIGALFYDRGNALILNDYYNADYKQATQQFSTARNIFSTAAPSSSSWQIAYMSFIGRSYLNRRIMEAKATSTHFAKSRNESANFRGSDDKAYTKSNKKFITGIVWFGKNGRPLAITKFSEPILKQENTDLDFNIKIDL